MMPALLINKSMAGSMEATTATLPVRSMPARTSAASDFMPNPEPSFFWSFVAIVGCPGQKGEGRACPAR